MRRADDTEVNRRQLAMRIAIASGKGGTGKTTVATNLAVVLNDMGYNVTYADCDVEEPNGHLFLTPDPENRTEVSVMVPVVSDAGCSLCGICAEVCEFNALAVLGTKVLPFPSLCHSCGACITLCPEGALDEGTRLVGFIRTGESRGLSFVGGCLSVGEAQAPPMIRAIKRRLPDDRIVVLDAPPGTSCPVVEAVRDSDYVILVTEPTPFGLNDLRLAVGMLRELECAFGVVINRCDIGDSLVREYCERENVRILLELPFERRIAEAYAAGRLGVDESAEYREKIERLYQSIEQELTDVRACRSQR
jgi:MinD superfamily P-loop ATPase